MQSNNNIFTFNQDLENNFFDFNPFNSQDLNFESPDSYTSAASMDFFNNKAPSTKKESTDAAVTKNLEPIPKPYDYVVAINSNPDITEYMRIGVQNNLKLYCRYPDCEKESCRFQTYLDLAQHMNTHLSKSSFRPQFFCNGIHKFAKSCPFTVLGFKTDVEVKEHKLLRCCDGCNKLFSRADNLATHLRPNADNITPCQKKLKKLVRKQLGLKRSHSLTSRPFRKDSFSKSPQKKVNSPNKSTSTRRKSKSMDYGILSETVSSNDSIKKLQRAASAPNPFGQVIESIAFMQEDSVDSIDSLSQYDLFRSPELTSTSDSIISMAELISPMMNSFQIVNENINNDALDEFTDSLFESLSTTNASDDFSCPSSQTDNKIFFQLPKKGTFYQPLLPSKTLKQLPNDDSSQYEYSVVTYDPKNIDWSRI